MEDFLRKLNCVNCPLQQDIFRNLSERELQILNEGRYEVSYKSGETVFKQGTPLTHIACVTSGMLKIYIEGLNNKNLLIKIAGANEIIGGPGLYTDFKHHFTVAALKDTSICQIDVDAFREVIQMNSNFALSMMRRNNIQGVKNFKKFINLTQKHMPGRIADAIFYLAEEVHGGEEFTTPISRQDLADMTAMTKESAIRILKEFRDAGLMMIEGNHFKILQREQLKKVSQKG